MGIAEGIVNLATTFVMGATGAQAHLQDESGQPSVTSGKPVATVIDAANEQKAAATKALSSLSNLGIQFIMGAENAKAHLIDAAGELTKKSGKPAATFNTPQQDGP